MSLAGLFSPRRVGWFLIIAGLTGAVLLFWRQPSPKGSPASTLPPPDPRFPVCPPDWTVAMVAEAPQLRHPTAVTCAPDGRVFVGEDLIDMEGPVDQPIDRVVCVHPDGRITLFATNLHCVFGLQYLDGKLYVNHAPKFSVFTDLGSTGSERVDLFDYRNPRQLQLAARSHIPANFRFGMDGFFYMAVGDNGLYRMKSRAGKELTMRGGGVIRFRPDGSDAEIFSTGTRNHPDVAINDEDELFNYDNDDDGEGWWTRVSHLVDGGFYGYPFDYRPPQPYMLPAVEECGFGVPTSAVVCNEDALPPEYRDNLFLGDFGRSEVRRVRLGREGATYHILAHETQAGLEFLSQARTQSQFRPVGMAFSSDGLSLYVTDWATHLELVRTEAGRLWRVTYAGKSRAVPKPAWFQAAALGQPCKASMTELVAGLKHPAQSVRLVAQRRLAERGEAAVKPLASLLADTSARPRSRWHALWTLDRLGGAGPPRSEIVAALRDADPSLRRQAARQLGTRRAAAAPHLLPLLGDPEASVRFQAATALGRIGSVSPISALLHGLSEEDRFVRQAMFRALNRIGRASPEGWPQIAAGLESTQPAIRQGTLFALRESWADSLVAALSGQLNSATNSAEGRAAAVRALGEIARQPAAWDGEWWGLKPVTRPRPPRTQDWSGTGIALEALRTAVTDLDPVVRRSAVEGLRDNHETNGAALLLRRWKEEPDPEVAEAILDALGEFKAPALGEALESLFKAQQPRQALLPSAAGAAEKLGGPAMIQLLSEAAVLDIGSTALRRVIQALGRIGGETAIPIIAQHLANPDPNIWKTAIKALVAIRGDRAAESLLPLLRHGQPELRHEAVLALATLASKATVPALVAAWPDDATGVDVTYALTQIPDMRALDVYLQGLRSPKAPLVELCLQAVSGIQDEALPAIEERLATLSLSPSSLARLQRLNDGFTVTEWSVAGPFAATNIQAKLFAELPEDGQLREATGKTNLWRHVSGRPITGRLDLRRALGLRADETNAWVYAAVVILGVPGITEIELMPACGDPLALWLNGEPFPLPAPTTSYALPRARATLKPGNNSVIARLGPVRSGALALRGSRPLEAQRSPEAYAAYARTQKGDPARGAELFRQASPGCIRCHRIKGEGGSIGPDLSGVGAKYAREQLMESVLQPSRQIVNGYQQTILFTKDGETVSGLLQSEDSGRITLVDANNIAHSVDKPQITDRKLSDVSIMPEGLQEGLSLELFADLMAYLESLK